MADQVFIQGLQIDTCIGVYDWERKIRQRVVLDITLEAALQRAARSDALADTVDYKALCDRLIARVGEARFELLEALADDIIRCIFEEFPVDTVRLRLSKPGAVPAAREVGVLLSRRRSG